MGALVVGVVVVVGSAVVEVVRHNPQELLHLFVHLGPNSI